MSTNNQHTVFSRDTATTVWAVLVAATGLTWWVGAQHGMGVSVLATTTLIATAMLKVWLIGNYFMEGSALPPILRRVYWSWLAITTVVLIAMVNLP